jgi:hypothetical protein
MTFNRSIEQALARYDQNGQFLLLPHESINEVVRRENVPNAFGVYIILRSDIPECPLYIGKAGTLCTNGKWKRQGIRKRLTMKQGKGKVYRKECFRKLMADKGLAELRFLWFVTHDQTSGVIPALAEMELLQAHFDQFRCLPELNKSV